MVRVDKGKRRGPKKGRVTMVGIMRSQHAAVVKTLRRSRRNGQSNTRDAELTDEVKQEIALQKTRLAGKAAAALENGGLAAEDAVALKELLEATPEASCKRRRRPAAKQMVFARPKGAGLTAVQPCKSTLDKLNAVEKYVYVDGALGSVTVPSHLKRVRSSLDADVVIAPGGNRDLQLVAWLVGARLAGPEWFSGQSPGKALPASVRFAAAVSMRRLWIYFTPGLRASRKRPIETVEEAAMKPFSKWTILKEKLAWERWHQSRPTQCFQVFADQALAQLSAQPKGSIGWNQFLLGCQRPLRIVDGLVRAPSAAEAAHKVAAPCSVPVPASSSRPSASAATSSIDARTRARDASSIASGARRAPAPTAG